MTDNATDSSRWASLKEQFSEILTLPGANARTLAGSIVTDYIIDRESSQAGSATRLVEAIEVAIGMPTPAAAKDTTVNLLGIITHMTETKESEWRKVTGIRYWSHPATGTYATVKSNHNFVSVRIHNTNGDITEILDFTTDDGSYWATNFVTVSSLD